MYAYVNSFSSLVWSQASTFFNIRYFKNIYSLWNISMWLPATDYLTRCAICIHQGRVSNISFFFRSLEVELFVQKNNQDSNINLEINSNIFALTKKYLYLYFFKGFFNLIFCHDKDFSRLSSGFHRLFLSTTHASRAYCFLTPVLYF